MYRAIGTWGLILLKKHVDQRLKYRLNFSAQFKLMSLMILVGKRSPSSLDTVERSLKSLSVWSNNDLFLISWKAIKHYTCLFWPTWDIRIQFNFENSKYLREISLELWIPSKLCQFKSFVFQRRIIIIPIYNIIMICVELLSIFIVMKIALCKNM